MRCVLNWQCSRGKTSTHQMIDDDEDERNQKKQGRKKEPHTTRPWGLILILEIPIRRFIQNRRQVTLKKLKGTHKETKKASESAQSGDASSIGLLNIVF